MRGGVILSFALLNMLSLKPATAQPNLVINGDFEQGTVPDGLGQIDRATGWTNAGSIGSSATPSFPPSPDLMDAASPNPNFGVPTNQWHSNLADVNAAQGKKRYVYIYNSLNNSQVTQAETVTGSLIAPLNEGCYNIDFQVARPTEIIVPVPNYNHVVVTLKSSTNPAASKLIYNATGGVNAVQLYTWTARSATFTVDATEATDQFDRIEIGMTHNPAGSGNRTNSALIDEFKITKTFEVGANLPATVRLCLGTELVLTPAIDYHGHTTSHLVAQWSKSPMPWNHVAAPYFWDGTYTLKDYPLQNTTYTFTASDNGCSDTYTVEVIVEDLVKAEIQGSFTECDLEGTELYQLTNNLAGVNVSWVISGGTLQLPPILNPHFAEVTWNPNHVGPKYLVVHQDSWTCARSDTLFIQACCELDSYPPPPEPPLPIMGNAIRFVNTTHSNEFSQSIISVLEVAYIEINGTYVIDEDATYVGIEFVMGPGARINIVTNNVIFQNCTFRACSGEMWYGIDLIAAQVTFDQCLVKESEFGVRIDESFYDTYQNYSLVNFHNCTFQQNYTAINVVNRDQAGARLDNNYINLNDCQFFGNMDVALLKPYDQVISVQGTSTIYRNSLAAIKLENSLGVRIGNLNNSSNVNSFNGLNNGILGRFSQVEVYNASFSNIQTSELVSKSNHSLAHGAAVKLNNINTPYFARDERSRVTNATFTNCQRGVEGFFTDSLRVESCNFNQVNFGIRVVNDFGKPSIKHNSIDANQTGVSVGTTFSPFWIGNFYASILHNDIVTRNAGVDVITQRAKIEGNTIAMDYQGVIAPFVGIRVRNAVNYIMNGQQEGNVIRRNYIHLINGTPPPLESNMYHLNRGIHVEHGGYLKVNENYVQTIITGLLLEGLTWPEVHISCNTFEGNYVGINRVNNEITPQGSPNNPADNRWLGIKATNARVWESAYVPASIGMDYYHRGQTLDFSNMFSPAPFRGLVDAHEQNNETNKCNYSILEPIEPFEGEQNYFDLAELESLANGDIDFDALGPLMEAYHQYYSEYNTLRALKSDTSLRESLTMDEFYLLMEAELRNQLSDGHTALLTGNLEAYGNFRNNALSNSIYDSLELVVADIYARSWAIPSVEVKPFDSLDYQKLFQIANLDIAAGGEAVYTARVMLGIDPVPSYAGMRRQQLNDLEFAEAENIRVFPNPAQYDVKFAWPKESDKNLDYQIRSIEGKVVAKGKAGMLDGYGHIDLQGLPNGVYLLQIGDQLSMQQTKLIVMKP